MWITNSINTYDTNYENALNITGDMFEKDSDNSLRIFTNNILIASKGWCILLSNIMVRIYR